MSPGPSPLQRARRLLALDCAGAGLTAAITVGALASGAIESGVPLIAWWLLGGAAGALGIAGALALRRPGFPGMALSRLAMANVAYAACAVGVVIACRDSVALLVAAYVAVEAFLLLLLAAAEWRASRRA